MMAAAAVLSEGWNAVDNGDELTCSSPKVCQMRIVRGYGSVL